MRWDCHSPCGGHFGAAGSVAGPDVLTWEGGGGCEGRKALGELFIAMAGTKAAERERGTARQMFALEGTKQKAPKSRQIPTRCFKVRKSLLVKTRAKVREGAARAASSLSLSRQRGFRVSIHFTHTRTRTTTTVKFLQPAARPTWLPLCLSTLRSLASSLPLSRTSLARSFSSTPFRVFYCRRRRPFFASARKERKNV